MRVMIIHNQYQHYGGEDRVAASESDLLREHGHEVSRFSVSNDSIAGLAARIRTAWDLPYSRRSRAMCATEVAKTSPDLVHIHNLFPLITPSVLDVFADAHIPVVMTLHNYRLLCAGALLMKGGRVCTSCLGSSPFWGAVGRCYRGSILGSAALARSISVHRRWGTWERKVHRFIVLTDFARNLFTEAGFPEERLVVKPNFCSSGVGTGSARREGALFVGRLSPEKGMGTLITAWSGVRGQLRVVGSGEWSVDGEASPRVCFCGSLGPEDVADEMAKASFLVMPSEWFEGFPMVIVEAFAAGLPVLASRLGAMAEIVRDGVTGLHFEPGNPQDLAAKANWLLENPEDCRRMGMNARGEYELRYAPNRNYELLMHLYSEATDEARIQYAKD